MSMLVKKFEADNMAGALKLVKDALGADALILSTKTLSKKGLGVLGKQTIEVTAAIESPAMSTPKSRVIPAAEPAAASRIPRAYRNQAAERTDLPERPERQERVELAELPLVDDYRQLKTQAKGPDVDHLQTEINQLKEMLQQLTKASAAPAPAAPEPVAVAAPAAPVERRQAVTPSVARSKPQGVEDLIATLTERGIDAEAATTIARFAAQQMTERQRQDPQSCFTALSRTITDLIQTSGPLWQPGDEQKRVSLVGPTGVGKTTTIAKLAAEAIMQSGARVALVTIDTFRIAAVEQLKVYGEIMGLPVEVVLSPEQLQDAFRRHRDKDLILIDTAGRSPRDSERIEELNEFLSTADGVENCLVLAAPTEERLQKKALESFGQMGISRLIFTKLDETDRCGSLINLSIRSNLPLAYLTNGQQVPEDMFLAEPETVTAAVMGTDSDVQRMVV
jgi:flagellar biosynthesis protein FlhF